LESVFQQFPFFGEIGDYFANIMSIHSSRVMVMFNDTVRGMNMRTICMLLSLLMTLQGCTNVSFRYHDEDGDDAAVKVYPYWTDDEGERHIVGGLWVELYPKYVDAGYILKEQTDPQFHLRFDDLDPGIYRLKVYIDEDTKVSEVIELIPGKKLTVRVDVEGVERKEAILNSIEKFGQGVGDVCIVIGETILFLTVIGLSVYVESTTDSDED
jgi:hypothetical protein